MKSSGPTIGDLIGVLNYSASWPVDQHGFAVRSSEVAPGIIYPSSVCVPFSIKPYPRYQGQLVAWGLLKYFRRRRTVASVRRHAHSPRRPHKWVLGVHRLGLCITAHGQWNAESTSEGRAISRLRRLGLLLDWAVQFDQLVALLEPGRMVVPFFVGDDGTLECSPIFGTSKGWVILPYSFSRRLRRRDFVRRWLDRRAGGRFALVRREAADDVICNNLRRLAVY
jgi:hypothetical protein